MPAGMHSNESDIYIDIKRSPKPYAMGHHHNVSDKHGWMEWE